MQRKLSSQGTHKVSQRMLHRKWRGRRGTQVQRMISLGTQRTKTARHQGLSPLSDRPVKQTSLRCSVRGRKWSESSGPKRFVVRRPNRHRRRARGKPRWATAHHSRIVKIEEGSGWILFRTETGQLRKRSPADRRRKARRSSAPCCEHRNPPKLSFHRQRMWSQIRSQFSPCRPYSHLEQNRCSPQKWRHGRLSVHWRPQAM
jgi:hypothetical protein